MSLLTALLLVANVFGAGMIVPQVLRLRRTRSTNGVSATGVGVGVGLNAWWTVYGVAERLWGIIPVSLVAWLLYLWMAHLLIELSGRPGLAAMVRGAVVPVLAPLAGFVVGGWTLVALVIGLGYGIQFAPAAWVALRSPAVDGLSPLTWSMAAVEAAIWTTYGVDIGDPALLVGGVGGLLMAGVILVRLAVEPIRRRPIEWGWTVG